MNSLFCPKQFKARLTDEFIDVTYAPGCNKIPHPAQTVHCHRKKLWVIGNNSKTAIVPHGRQIVRRLVIWYICRFAVATIYRKGAADWITVDEWGNAALHWLYCISLLIHRSIYYVTQIRNM